MEEKTLEERVKRLEHFLGAVVGLHGVGTEIKLLDENAIIPKAATGYSAGHDLCSIENYTLMPGERKLIRTGIAIALPLGCEAQIRPRSGLAIKHGVTVINTPGTIDADYRGEICVPMVNLGEEPYEIKAGERVAQMVIEHWMRAIFKKVDELSSTERGEGGFGHTGK